MNQTISNDKYAQTLDHIFGLGRIGEKFDLEGPRALAKAMGNPELKSRAVLIGGTNGKGSTSAFLEAILIDAGLKTGLFTSPHLVSYRERIRINGEDVSEEEVSEVYPEIEAIAAQNQLHPTFFESTFALASRIFERAGVQVAIWETGLGGRLDTTNICQPVCSAVVSLGLEHTEILGPTLDHIAREKAGLFRAPKNGVPCNFTTAVDDALAALARQSPYNFEVVQTRSDLPQLPLPGEYQRRNASLALRLAESLGVYPDPSRLAEIFQKVRWPCRAERLGNVILDCAHNPHGAEALATWLDEAQLGPIHLIYGAMRGKDISKVAAFLKPRVQSVTLVTPTYPRRHEAQELLEVFADHPCVKVGTTVSEALDARPAEGVTLVAGSCFMAGEARAHLLGMQFPERGILTTVR